MAIVSLVIVCANHVLLRRRPAVGLWAGLWEPPGIERNGRPVARRIAARILPGSWYSRIKRYRRVGTSIHQLTHRRVAFEAFLGRLIGRPPSVTRAEHGPRHRWVRFDHLPEIGISQAHRSVLRFGVQ